MKTKTLDKKYLVRSSSESDIEIVKTEPFHFYDKTGKKYIDLMMGWCVGNLGWANKDLQNVLQNYQGPDYVYPGFIYKPWAELAELLASIAPGDLKMVYRTTGGSESVDAALQIAMVHTGRKKFCAIEGAYHGNTISTLSLVPSENKDKIPNLLQGCSEIKLPLDEKALKRVETKLKNNDVAAFIMEPVVSNKGVYIPEVEFMSGLQRLCKKHGTLLIVDEVATGFGRTGKIFASEHFNLKPDILCLSKAITGGYAGLGATLTTEKIAKKVKDKVSIYSTYGWHPRSTAVALANIKFMLNTEKDLFTNVDQASQQFRTALSQMKFKKGGKLSIIGLAIAIDLEDAKYAEKVQQKCLKNGLFLSNQEEKLVMFPS